MITANQIADYFIKRARDVGEPITNLKLQKLVYYAQAWHLALYDEQLFDGQFEAWVHGPVNRELYQRFKDCRWKPILDEIDYPELPQEVLEHVDEVWEVYGGLSAWDLEGLAHSETPWLEARGDIPSDESCETIISDSTMKAFYKKLLAAEEKDG